MVSLAFSSNGTNVHCKDSEHDRHKLVLAIYKTVVGVDLVVLGTIQAVAEQTSCRCFEQYDPAHLGYRAVAFH